jgi:response regulator RpfG family c-di-GMP phosphodiesterase
MKNKHERINMILIEDDMKQTKNLRKALTNLELFHSVRVFQGANPCIAHLKDTNTQVPHVLFFDINAYDCMDGIRAIRDDSKYNNLSIAVYDSHASITEEETFVAGANIYIRKNDNSYELKRILKKVLKIDWQFSSGKYNRDTYVLSV